ncbi:MAG: sugar ABC transporter permease [Turicibacter sp.]|nr:sugar ABC transporter permease [Turicibacter sp.]
MKARTREGIQGYSFMIPALIIIAVFTIVPIGYAIYLSFTRVNLLAGTFEWVGFGNYEIAFSDPRLRIALRNTVRYAVFVVPAQTFLALVMATVLNSGVKFERTFRTIFFLPTLTSSAALTMIFMFLFAVNGPVNGFLVEWGLLAAPINFVEDVNFALNTIMVMNVWSTAPLFMTIYLAGLQDVDKTLYEAAAIDGANAWKKFTKITIPNLVPVTNYVLLMGIIGTFQIFDQAFIISGGSGGPMNATLTVSLLIYQFAFQVRGTMGYASALAILLAILIFVVSMIAKRLNKEESLY